jgi:hypothetical protein
VSLLIFTTFLSRPTQSCGLCALGGPVSFFSFPNERSLAERGGKALAQQLHDR